MQQINVRFLNLPEPDVTERVVSSAARAYSLARGWSEEVRAVGLAEILPPAAASMVATLLDRIAAGKVVDAEALELMASVLDALVAYRDARTILTEARRRLVEALGRDLRPRSGGRVAPDTLAARLGSARACSKGRDQAQDHDLCKDPT